MMKKIFSLVFFLLTFVISYSQQQDNLEGRITDAENKAIANASISLLNTGKSVLSDEEGNFILKSIPTGHFSIEITAIGYASITQTISIPYQGKLHIQMNKEAQVLDDIVVSAQKREEELQRVPLSISSLNARQVQQYRLWNSNELTAVSPNLYSANSGDDRNVTSIRGITTTSYDPAVATYVDGVNQFGLDTYLGNLFDVERIEVLRGPQGTLYGRNAMGGVINIITKQPDNQLHGFAEISMGNFAQERWIAGLRAPIVRDKLFIGVTGMYENRDGYYTNKFNNHSYDDQHSSTGNYYIKWLAGRGWEAQLNIKHRNNRNNGAFPLVFGVQDAFDHPFELNQNATATMIDNTNNASISILHHGSKVNFSSQTSYQSNRRVYDHPLDGDFSPLDGLTIINNYDKPWNKVKAYTEELRLVSAPSARSPLQWTTGLYLYYQDNPNKQTSHFGENADMLGSPDKNFSLINTNKSKSHGAALYGQVSYPISKKLQIIAGARYDYEKKKYSVMSEYQPDNSDPFTILPDTSASVDYSAFSPKLGLSWEIQKNSQFYFNYSRGFRTGGLTQLSTDPSQPPLFAYKPEYSHSFEAGLKNSFLQNHVRLNLALFYARVNDAQVPTLILPDAITVTRNAGKLESRGAELELGATALKGLELQYNFGYTHAEYTELKLPDNGQSADRSGNRQVFTPDVTSQLAIQFNQPLMDDPQLNLVLRGEWAYLGKQYFDLANQISQPGYSLLNGRAGLSMKQWELMFWIRNIGDKKYIAYAYDFGAVHLGNPRTLGITLRWQY